MSVRLRIREGQQKFGRDLLFTRRKSLQVGNGVFEQFDHTQNIARKTLRTKRSQDGNSSLRNAGRMVGFALLYPPYDAFFLETQRLGLLHLRQCAHLGQHFIGEFAVDLDQRHRVAADCFASDVEGGDVDAGVAERR
jgi:hypothetical protein